MRGVDNDTPSREDQRRTGTLSEIHLGCFRPAQAEGAGVAPTVTTRFAFFPPSSRVLGEDEEEEEEDDDDGDDDDDDLKVRRKRRRVDGQQCITIRHRLATDLPDVGLQVRGSAFYRVGTLLSAKVFLEDAPDATRLSVSDDDQDGHVDRRDHLCGDYVTPASQVWRGALLLCDWLLHAAAGGEKAEDEERNACTPPQPITDTVVLELGAGTGLVGQLAARCGAKHVFITDAPRAVLSNCAANVAADTHPLVQSRCCVRRLDWKGVYRYINDTRARAVAVADAATSAGRGEGRESLGEWIAAGSRRESCANEEEDDNDTSHMCQISRGSGGSNDADNVDPYDWSPEDMTVLARCELILAADCIYDDDLTDAFFATLAAVLRGCSEGAIQQADQSAKNEKQNTPGSGRRSQLRALCAMERRINFAVGDETPRAHAFEYFLLHLGLRPDESGKGFRLADVEDIPMASRGVFSGRRVDPFDVPQRVAYNRVSELELWEVALQNEVFG